MKTKTWAPLTAGTALALALPAVASAADCAGLKAKSTPQTEIVAATAHPGGDFTVPGTARPQPMPAFCRVQALLHPTPDSAITVELWLPEQGWNGKFQGLGNGGYAGSIGYPDLAAGVKAGYAVAATDTGHTGGLTDAKWAKDHPERIVDYGWRAVHLTAVTGKALTGAYYGSAPKRAYFASCSNGGRQGLMEAQRFPEDYDGIIAGAPAYNGTHLFTGFIWNSRALNMPGARIVPAKTPAIEAAVLKRCDALDGAADGLLSDPMACHFDAQELKCAAEETNACLTPAQIAALDAIRQGPKDSKGKPIYYGFLPGNENQSGWNAWIFGAVPGAGIQTQFGSNFARYMMTGTEAWTPADFDFDKGMPAQLHDTLDATNPDLSKFAARGGKLILFHGWADPAIPAQGTIAYRDEVAQKMGARRADSFTRLFLAPGMGHCNGGAGPSDFDQGRMPTPGRDPSNSLAAALEAWVEQGKAPQQVIARAPAAPAGQPPRTGPLCAHPARAVLTAGSDPLKAESYTCKVTKKS